ncbi:MAG: barstar family protein [Lachnospiraceae bacterium]|nr:barstar family protein [Lachnospiraceae bacterium]
MRPSQDSIRERVFYIDLTGVTDRDALQERLCAALPMPAHYGRNLNALYDVLTENGAGWNLILYRSLALEHAQPKLFATLTRLLDEAAGETPGMRVRWFRG